MRKFLVGVDLGGTKIYTAASKIDDPQKIVSENTIKTEASKGLTHSLQRILLSIDEAMSDCEISANEVAAIGICVPGPVDPATGTVHICPNLPGWENVAVQKILQDRYAVPVHVENDAKAAGLAESIFGAGKNYRHLFYITISTGVGGAIIVDNRIFSGIDGAAGEIGQTRLIDGTVFEKTASGTAIKNLFGINPEEIPDLLKKNDVTAEKALSHLVKHIGIWLSNITTLLNPEVIVVGGGVSNLGEILLDPVRKIIRRNSFSISGQRVRIVPSVLGKRVGVLGALALPLMEKK